MKALLVFNGQVPGILEEQQYRAQSTMEKNCHRSWMNFKHSTEYIYLRLEFSMLKKCIFQLLMYPKFSKMQPYYKSICLFRALLRVVHHFGKSCHQSQCHLGMWITTINDTVSFMLSQLSHLQWFYV